MTRRYTVTTYYEEEKKSSSLFGTCLCIMLIVTIAGFATNNPSNSKIKADLSQRLKWQ